MNVGGDARVVCWLLCVWRRWDGQRVNPLQHNTYQIAFFPVVMIRQVILQVKCRLCRGGIEQTFLCIGSYFVVCRRPVILGGRVLELSPFILCMLPKIYINFRIFQCVCWCYILCITSNFQWCRCTWSPVYRMLIHSSMYIDLQKCPLWFVVSLKF